MVFPVTSVGGMILSYDNEYDVVVDGADVKIHL